MKKRGLCIALCLCLLTGALPALAQDGGALRVLNDGWFVSEDYLAQYPDRSLELIPAEYLDNGIDTNLRELIFTTDWDVARITTDELTLRELDEAGLLMDLTELFGEEKLYPAVREAVTVDGRIMGVPTMGWYMGARYRMQWLDGDPYGLGEKLGLTEADEPHTYAELYALAQKYFALDAETRRGTLFFDGMLNGQAGVLLLSSFIQQYAGEFADAEGNVDYDTDAFRDGVRQIKELTALLGDNLKPLYNEGSTTLYMLVSDAANHPLGNETLFSVGTERKVPMRLEVWVMNARTGKADEAADYIRAAMARSAPEFAPALYEEYDYVALLRASLDRDIEAQKEQNEAQSVIDELIRLRDAGEAEGRYYSREQLERYRTEVAPYLIFPSCGYVDGWTPANSYMKGKLDMDGLIAKLNEQ